MSEKKMEMEKGKNELGGGFDTNMRSSSCLHTLLSPDFYMLLFQFHVSNDKDSHFYPRQKNLFKSRSIPNISTLCS